VPTQSLRRPNTADRTLGRRRERSKRPANGGDSLEISTSRNRRSLRIRSPGVDWSNSLDPDPVRRPGRRVVALWTGAAGAANPDPATARRRPGASDASLGRRGAEQAGGSSRPGRPRLQLGAVRPAPRTPPRGTHQRAHLALGDTGLGERRGEPELPSRRPQRAGVVRDRCLHQVSLDHPLDDLERAKRAALPEPEFPEACMSRAC
jgi:hypothetical protein